MRSEDEGLTLRQAIERARELAGADPAEPGDVVVCRGPPACGGTDVLGCPWCVRLRAGEDRSTDDLIEEMRRGH